MRIISITLFTLILGIHHLYAQTISLTLGKCYEMGTAQSPQAKMAALELKGMGYDYELFANSYKPQLSLSGSMPGLNRSYSIIPQNTGENAFRYLNQVSSSLSLFASKQIYQTGGTVTAFSGLNNNFQIGSSSANMFPWNVSPIGIQFRQPLFQMNNMKWDRREADLRKKLAFVTYNQAVEDAGFAAIQQFLDALDAQNSLAMAEFNVANNDTIYALAKGRFSVGKIAENDLLQSELSLMNARATLEGERMRYQRVMQNLKTNLGIDRAAEIVLVPPRGIPQIDITPEFAVEQALQHSKTIKDAEMTRLGTERALVGARSRNRFSADLSASFGLNQIGTTPLDAYSRPEDQEQFNIQFSIPILQWGKRNIEIQAAEVRLKQSEMSLAYNQQNFADNVYYQAANLRQLRSRLEIAARSDTIATRRYDISRKRYALGKIGIQDLLIAQGETDHARRSYNTNLSQYWKALAELRKNTLYDFIKNEPVMHKW